MSIAFKAGHFVGNAGKLAIAGIFSAGSALAKAGSAVVDGAHSFTNGVGDGFAGKKPQAVRKPKPKPAAQPSVATKKAAAPVRRTRAKSVPVSA